MEFYSTNNRQYREKIRQAVLQGLAPDSGLFMPVQLPVLPRAFFDKLSSLSLPEIAYEVSAVFLQGAIGAGELSALVSEVFNFSIPLRQLAPNLHVLELFHGPTLAFKDVGARFMSRLMAHFNQEELVVLVATSGDTGSAVASGFYELPGIKVVILYPSGKVSEMQEKQLTTYGKNVHALEVEGTFDDCQAMVKKAFQDKALQELHLTTANSINLARLIPQSFYYFYAVAQLAGSRPPAFSVPSGNFGNLTAGLFASHMGLRVEKYLASTNQNDIVPDYLESGIFEPRSSVRTLSNAMDVGNPSNFARIQALYGQVHEKVCQDVVGYGFSDTETLKAIEELHRKWGYVADPHAAIAYAGLKKYRDKWEGPGIFLATAHPAKFKEVVEEAIGQELVVPERLAEVLQKEKKATLIPNAYNKLQEYLLAL